MQRHGNPCLCTVFKLEGSLRTFSIHRSRDILKHVMYLAIKLVDEAAKLLNSLCSLSLVSHVTIGVKASMRLDDTVFHSQNLLGILQSACIPGWQVSTVSVTWEKLIASWILSQPLFDLTYILTFRIEAGNFTFPIGLQALGCGGCRWGGRSCSCCKYGGYGSCGHTNCKQKRKRGAFLE